MSPKRGDRVAPPARPSEYELRFATNDAAKGWEELCRQAAGNTRTAFETIRSSPCPAPPIERQHRLKHDLAWGTHGGQRLEQWQYEVTLWNGPHAAASTSANAWNSGSTR
ncbi:MAG TPA: hypothetical protein VFB84_21140 [Micromonosporaceae bacterium]|nr:hypothetical protein [Micromonosporaceae bacterium]